MSEEGNGAFLEHADELLRLPHCWGCLPTLENFLLNNPCTTYCLSIILYFPIMTFCFFLFLCLLPLTLLLNLFSFIFCIGRASCCLPRDASVLPRDVLNAPPKHPNTREYFTLLQFNTFNIWGRVWARHQLYTKLFNKYQPDMYCVQEAVVSALLPIGTLNTIYQIGRNDIQNDQTNDQKIWYDGFDVSMARLGKIVVPAVYRYSVFEALKLYEVQNVMNGLFWLPVWRTTGFNFILNSSQACQGLFCYFVNFFASFGNALAFKASQCHFKDVILLEPGFRMCLRGLYVTPVKQAKIWVFCTHLTAETESVYQEKNPSEAEPLKTGINAKVTVAQVNKVLDWIELTQKNVCTGDGVIVCGDFNSTPDTTTYTLMKQKGFESAIFAKYGEEKITFPTGTWNYMDRVEHDFGPRTLDYVWYKGDIELTNAKRVGDEWGLTKNIVDEYNQECKLYPSDHFGILAKFCI